MRPPQLAPDAPCLTSAARACGDPLRRFDCGSPRRVRSHRGRSAGVQPDPVTGPRHDLRLRPGELEQACVADGTRHELAGEIEIEPVMAGLAREQARVEGGERGIIDARRRGSGIARSCGPRSAAAIEQHVQQAVRLVAAHEARGAPCRRGSASGSRSGRRAASSAARTCSKCSSSSRASAASGSCRKRWWGYEKRSLMAAPAAFFSQWA